MEFVFSSDFEYYRREVIIYGQKKCLDDSLHFSEKAAGISPAIYVG